MSKNLQNNGKGLFPNSFSIKEIRLERFDGNDAVFIQPIVTKLIINESIYTNSLTAEISVKDTVNLFGSFPIIGNEKITIKIVTDVAIAKGGKRTINLDFYVTDVPVFGRGREPNVQAFVLSCISPHAYISSLKQISRSFKNNFATEINDILLNDLFFENQIFTGESRCVSTGKGIITTRSPLKAIEMFRNRCADNEGNPFYLFQRLDGNIYFLSLSDLLSQESYYTYVYSKDFQANAQTLKDYTERKKRILQIQSNLEMSKISQAKNGKYASRNNYLDTSLKTFNTFSYEKSQSQNDLSNFSEFQGKPYSKYHQAYDVYIPVNDLSFSNEISPSVKNINDIRKNKAHLMRSAVADLNNMTHDVTLFGDLDLNPGRVININFPSAVDPQVSKKNRDFDKTLSGRHLVTEVSHRFENEEYQINLMAKRI